MVEGRGGHVPVRKVRRPNVGEVHGEVGDDAVEKALLFCVVRPEKENFLVTSSGRYKKPKAKRHCRDHNRDEETNAFEEDAFNNPNREASYAART